MAQEDYEVIARAMRKSRKLVTSEGSWIIIVVRLAIELATNNPRFNKEMFKKACFLEGGEQCNQTK